MWEVWCCQWDVPGWKMRNYYSLMRFGGVTYALSAAMIYEGIHEEPFQTANGVFLVSWSEVGLVTFSPFPSCIPVFATER
jgi:hypothetical protein